MNTPPVARAESSVAVVAGAGLSLPTIVTVASVADADGAVVAGALLGARGADSFSHPARRKPAPRSIRQNGIKTPSPFPLRS
jgi:hypothetical protein